MSDTTEKPHITYGELAWFAAFKRVIARGAGARFTANGVKYRLKHWNPDSEYAWVILVDSNKEERTVRRGDVLMLELRSCSA
jgi:hypothetical protein